METYDWQKVIEAFDAKNGIKEHAVKMPLEISQDKFMLHPRIVGIDGGSLDVYADTQCDLHMPKLSRYVKDITSYIGDANDVKRFLIRSQLRFFSTYVTLEELSRTLGCDFKYLEECWIEDLFSMDCDVYTYCYSNNYNLLFEKRFLVRKTDTPESLLMQYDLMHSIE